MGISISVVHVGLLNQPVGLKAPPFFRIVWLTLQWWLSAVLRISLSMASWSALALKGTVWVSGRAGPEFHDLTATSTSTLMSQFSASTKRTDVLLATQPYLWWSPWGGSDPGLPKILSLVFLIVSCISRQGGVVSTAIFIWGTTSPSRSNMS